MLSLERYRMLDLSRMAPGPFTSKTLADLGMEVIKVEEIKPRGGMGRDPLTPPDPTPEEEERAAAYNGLARNKKSLGLDLLDVAKRPASQEVFYRLAKQADVVLEGYRPGALKWMGVDFETVKAHNPDIIYCSLTGFGQEGPYAQAPAHGPQFDALAGILQFDDRGRPTPPPFRLGDLTGGLYAALSIVSALLHREHTGQGQRIDVSLTSASMSLNHAGAAALGRDNQVQGAVRTTDRGLTYIKCADGKWLTTANAETHFWANFCNALGHPEWIPMRRQGGPEFDRMTEEARKLFLTKPREEWVAVLTKAETCVSPVNDAAEAFQDPQARHVGMVWEKEHPKVGKVTQLGFPVRYDGKPVPMRNFAPLLGQHTREVLAQSGFAPNEIAELEKQGIIKQWAGG